MAQPALQFSATIVDVDSKPPKLTTPASYSHEKPKFKGGGLTITLYVERPEMPEPPSEPREMQYAPRLVEPAFGRPAATFAAPEQNDGETDKGHKSRTAQLKKSWERDRDAWERYDRELAAQGPAREKHAAALARHQQRVERMGAEFADFARLAGVGAILNGLPVSITLRPSQAALNRHLPGFSPALMLLGPGDVVASVADEDEDAD